MNLEKKIRFLTMGIFIVVVTVISIFSLIIIDDKVTDASGKRLTDTAHIIAANPMIQNELANRGEPTHLKVQNFAERMRLKTNLLFITVMNMEGVRYSHPIPDNLGRKFIGGDEKDALLNGNVYVSEGEGHLGRSIRAFVPVYKDGVRVGAVSVGILKRDLRGEINAFFTALIPVFIMAIVVIILLAKKLAQNIKEDIYGLEPEEIAVELRTKDLIINNMEEGLIAVNTNGEIEVVNKKAIKILEIDSNDEVSDKILSKLKEVIYRRTAIFNQEIRINKDILIVANFYSVVGEYGKVVAAIASFQDFSKVHNMAEELTGIKELTWNLRAQNHEFMNKLHTIAGLIQLEENDKALEYIFETTEGRGLITDSIRGIKEPSIQGLIFSKYNRADEGKIKFQVDEECNLEKLPNGVKSQELITIIGNLLENSIEELRGRQDGWIYLGIFQIKSGEINILLKNNGSKINDIDKIFNRGYSSKGNNRGLGLYNIKEIVKGLNGTIKVQSDEITEWEIMI